MKKNILAAFVLPLTVAAAFAQTPSKVGGDANPSGISSPTPSANTTTRAEVKSEVKAASKDGALKGGDINPGGISPPVSPSMSTTTRAEVKAETKDAASRGELQTNDATMPGDKKPMRKHMRKHKMKSQKSTNEMSSTGNQSDTQGK